MEAIKVRTDRKPYFVIMPQKSLHIGKVASVYYDGRLDELAAILANTMEIDNQVQLVVYYSMQEFNARKERKARLMEQRAAQLQQQQLSLF